MTKPSTPEQNRFQSVPLSNPIVRGETKIDTVTLRKPRGGELRGLTLQDIIGTDIATILKLVPRISDPVLTDDECNNLEPEDLTEIGGAIRGFFMTKGERDLLAKLMEEQQPTH